MQTSIIGIDSALTRLRAWRDPKLPLKMANAMARSFLGDTLDWIDEGKSFTDRNKHEKYFHWKPESYGASVYVKSRHLVWMEQGTAPHTISPRRGRSQALRFRVGDGYLIRRLVHHPGTRPLPFFFAETPARLARARQAAIALAPHPSA